MKHLTEIVLAGALVLTGLSGSTGPAQAAEQAQKIDRLMRQYHDLGQFNGSALVAIAGEIKINRGYGLANKELGVPNDGKTRHRVGSITKSFTAALVVRLAEERQLDLEKTIRDYLPDYPPHAGGSITLRQLLTHTGGIPNYTRSSEFWHSGAPAIPLTAQEFVQRYCSGAPEFQPGERYQYGNSGYSILGAIIEAVTGRSYSDELRERLLEPAGMKDSGVDSASALMPHRASGYERTVGGYRNADPIPAPLFAAGSMVSTAEDLLRWARAFDDDRVLSTQVRQIVLKARPGAVEGTFAYGWNVGASTLGSPHPPLRYVATNGEINGFNALLLRLFDERHTIILLNNTGETNLTEMANNIVRVLYDLPVSEPEPRIVDTFLARLTGPVAEAVAFYRAQRESNPEDYLFFPWPLRMLGLQMLRDGRTDLAIKLLKLNAETHPSDVRTKEGLAEALRRSSDVRQ